MNFEIEIKLRLPPDISKIRRTLRKLGFRVTVARSHESNTLFDNPKDPLGKQGKLIRIRRVGRYTLLTYKGPSKSVRYKKRHELEVYVSDADVLEKIFKNIGYHPATSWSWKALPDGLAAPPGCSGFLRPITSRAATVIYTCSIAASAG